MSIFFFFFFTGRGGRQARKLNVRRFGLKVGSQSYFLKLPVLRIFFLPLSLLVPRIWHRFKLSFIICFLCMVMMVIFTTNIVPFEWQIPGYQWALIIPLSLVVGCHVLFPVRAFLSFSFLSN